MSPASYRAAPPRVGFSTLRASSAARKSPVQGDGELVLGPLGRWQPGQTPAFGAPGDAIQIMYLARHGAPGGWVSSCGSCVVARFSTSSGETPNAEACAGVESKMTGRQAALTMPPTTACTVAGGALSATAATGTPHIALITWLKTAATRRSTMITDEDRPIEEH